MKKFVMYGAGSIGRGFIGSLFSKIGYEVTFIDVNQEVVNLLNEHQQYDQIIVGEHEKTIHIENVHAIDGTNEQAVCDAIVSADLMATALGANVLPKVASLVAKGLEQRWSQRNNEPLDILICENLKDANHIFHDEIAKYVSDVSKLDAYVGFVETSIGKMVPPADNFEEQVAPLAVRQEEYEFLPVDKDAMKTKWPECENIISYSPFEYYVERKLYIHNMGHFTTSLLGMIEGYKYIYEAANQPSVLWIVKNCMEESAISLQRCYNIDYADLKANIDDLLYRFQNKALQDSVARVARDPMRKLQPSDRLVGAMRKCLEQGVNPNYICFSIALALYNLSDQDPSEILENVCGIHRDEIVYEWILEDLRLLENKMDLNQIIIHLIQQKHQVEGSVI